MSDICECGHKKSDHIYEEGACRSGLPCGCTHYSEQKNEHELLFNKWQCQPSDENFEEILKPVAYINEKIMDAVKYGFVQACKIKDEEIKEFKDAITTIGENAALFTTKMEKVISDKNEEIKTLQEKIKKLEQKKD